MTRRLWYQLVIWFGLRYNKWPWWWYDASDQVWTLVGSASSTDPDKATFTVEIADIQYIEFDPPETTDGR